MYQCVICGVTFDEPAFVPVRDWHSEVGCYETGVMPVCPVCGSENYLDLPEYDLEVDWNEETI